jgi:hypothetical protein
LINYNLIQTNYLYYLSIKNNIKKDNNESNTNFNILNNKIQSMEKDLKILCDNNLDGKEVDDVKSEL